MVICFFFNDTATTEIYTLSLHDALPIYPAGAGLATRCGVFSCEELRSALALLVARVLADDHDAAVATRSEEHTSELQSRQYLVCRLLLEKKKKHLCLFLLILDTFKHSYL